MKASGASLNLQRKSSYIEIRRIAHLATVGVHAGIGHGQDSGFGVLELEVLVREFLAVDGLAALAHLLVGVTLGLLHWGYFIISRATVKMRTAGATRNTGLGNTTNI